jgi:ribonuclease D
LTKFANTSNKHKEKAHKEMEDNPNYWLVRPMTAVMVDYAREDVIHLPYVYRQFKVMLDPRNIKLVMENSKKYVDQYR